MRYWLLKSEPDVYPFQQLEREKTGFWDGVRNHQAAQNLRLMQKNDRAFFYHSNIGRCIVGLMRISETAKPDPTDQSGKFVGVTVAYDRALPHPVFLSAIKATKSLSSMALLKQSRLSVSPVSAPEWEIILKLGGL